MKHSTTIAQHIHAKPTLWTYESWNDLLLKIFSSLPGGNPLICTAVGCGPVSSLDQPMLCGAGVAAGKALTVGTPIEATAPTAPCHGI